MLSFDMIDELSKFSGYGEFDKNLSSLKAREIKKLPTFLSLLENIENHNKKPFSKLSIQDQDKVVLYRLSQLVEICRSNSSWREMINEKIGYKKISNFSDFRLLPIIKKKDFVSLFAGSRDGLVVPLDMGGFQIANSGATSSGSPSEIIYSLQELWDTYRWAGSFMGSHLINPYFSDDPAPWVGTMLADRDLWSSGTMVGGVLQNIPHTNYLGIGSMCDETFHRVMKYSGPKCLMGTSQDILSLLDRAEKLNFSQRSSLKMVLYGSGPLHEGAQRALKLAYPNINILSFFAATQAETIGLQLSNCSDALTAIPGLHFIEIVKEDGEWALPGEEGNLVITRLFGNCSPILRLDLGDRVRRLDDFVSVDLNAIRFSYVGRSGDYIDFNGTKLYVPEIVDSIIDFLKKGFDFDLKKRLYNVQLNHGRDWQILFEVSEIPTMDDLMSTGRTGGSYGQSLNGKIELRSGNLFWVFHIGGESINVGIKFVEINSNEIIKTNLGKVPLVTNNSEK